MVFSRLEAVYNFAQGCSLYLQLTLKCFKSTSLEKFVSFYFVIGAQFKEVSEISISFWLLRFQVRGILKNKMEKVWNYLKTVFTCCGRDQEGAM